jgi:hypothetical protein
VTVLNFSVSRRVLLFQILWCGFGWRVASKDSNDRNQPNLLRIPWVRYSVNGFLLPQLVRGLLVSEYPTTRSSECLFPLFGITQKAMHGIGQGGQLEDALLGQGRRVKLDRIPG